jgi:hypothetical protein
LVPQTQFRAPAPQFLDPQFPNPRLCAALPRCRASTALRGTSNPRAARRKMHAA